MNFPVEVTTRFVTTVDDMTSAWSFVMDRIEAVGVHPHVEIRPIRILSPVEAMEGLTGVDQFEVVVEGMTREKDES